MKTTTYTITINECRHCDHTASIRPYGMDDVSVCAGCGAEWDPIPVQYDKSELQVKDDTCEYCGYPEDATGNCYCTLE